VSLLRGLLLPLAVLGGAALADAQEPSVPASALKACAAIGAPTERLACYDRMAERAPPPVAGATAPAASPAEVPKPSFGLYAAEHPAAPKPAGLLNAKIIGLGAGADGRTQVTLDGGQLWELDVADPLLAKGDPVTIKRAALGSFIMTTPTGRTHRAHRLR
jgi:hypothetical protein